jgi:hypothetical protein
MVLYRDSGQLWYAAPRHLACIWRLWTVPSHHVLKLTRAADFLGLVVLGMVDGRRRSGPTRFGGPGRWPISRGAARSSYIGGGRGGQEGEAQKAILDFALHRLKGDLFPDLMELMG